MAGRDLLQAGHVEQFPDGAGGDLRDKSAITRGCPNCRRQMPSWSLPGMMRSGAPRLASHDSSSRTPGLACGTCVLVGTARSSRWTTFRLPVATPSDGLSRCSALPVPRHLAQLCSFGRRAPRCPSPLVRPDAGWTDIRDFAMPAANSPHLPEGHAMTEHQVDTPATRLAGSLEEGGGGAAPLLVGNWESDVFA